MITIYAYLWPVFQTIFVFDNFSVDHSLGQGLVNLVKSRAAGAKIAAALGFGGFILLISILWVFTFLFRCDIIL